MKRAFLLGSSACLLLIGAAPPADRAGVLKAVTDCRAVSDAGQRLSCYDAAVARLDVATAKKDIVVLDREEVKETRRGLFGFPLPKLPFFRGDESQKEAAPAQIDAVATSARSLGYGKWRLVLDNGAIWETTESVTRHDPKQGSKIRIKAGSMTNYFLSIDGDPSVRAKRVG